VSAALRVFVTPADLGEYAAQRTLDAIHTAIAARGAATLGCPAGRSPRTTFAALARLAAARPFDGALLHIVMMDEYAEGGDGAWRWPPADAHYSCRGFAQRFILAPLNAVLGAPIPDANLHAPDAQNPEGYEQEIDALGGVDLFLLAAGASDGHVAFNPPGTPRDAGARRITLAPATRTDNLATFPQFGDIANVPAHGVSVGPNTIARTSRAALMLISGAEKTASLARIRGASGYDPAWPATIIHECRNAEILADVAALGAAEDAP
jgi:glucosamine-6-phosphate deaminase